MSCLLFEISCNFKKWKKFDSHSISDFIFNINSIKTVEVGINVRILWMSMTIVRCWFGIFYRIAAIASSSKNPWICVLQGCRKTWYQLLSHQSRRRVPAGTGNDTLAIDYCKALIKQEDVAILIHLSAKAESSDQVINPMLTKEHTKNWLFNNVI